MLLRIELRQKLRHRNPRPLPPDDNLILMSNNIHKVIDPQMRMLKHNRSNPNSRTVAPLGHFTRTGQSVRHGVFLVSKVYTEDTKFSGRK